MATVPKVGCGKLNVNAVFDPTTVLAGRPLTSRSAASTLVTARLNVTVTFVSVKTVPAGGATVATRGAAATGSRNSADTSRSTRKSELVRVALNPCTASALVPVTSGDGS